MDETKQPTRWQPGQSGNPKGRPKQPKNAKEVRSLAQQYTVQMVEVLSKVALNPKAPPAARTAAAEAILSRAWGRPASLDLEGAEQLIIRVVKFNGPQIDEASVKTIEHDGGGNPMAVITLPYNFTLRPYQKPLWNYLESGGRRAIAAWHRRAGKDQVCLNWMACAAMQRVGTYWYLLPEISMARKSIWDAVDGHSGLRRIDQAFPRAIRESTIDNEMKIKLRNGSLIQVLGSDNFHSLVGTPPVGLVFSEWARAVPEAWGYLNPILTENRGFACFLSTPLGNNHFKRMLDEARTNPKWFCEVLPVQASGAIEPEALEESRREYSALYGEVAGQALFAQEYECSFASVIPGSYYTAELTSAEREGRVGQVDIAKDMPVNTAWDLGVDDATAIWCWQMQPGRLHLVDYYENSGHGASHYCEWLNERGYHGVDFVPHDARVREFGSGRTRIETLRSLGRKPRLVPNHTVIDGINASRKTIEVSHFDAARCQRGVDCLRAYCAEWDENLRTFRKTPKNDWASHAADAFRYLSMSWREPIAPEEEPDPIAELLRPRTWNEIWQQHVDEQIDGGADPETFDLTLN